MDPTTNFKVIILQTELERFKFLVRSFLRTRLKKVLFFPSLPGCLPTYLPTSLPATPLADERYTHNRSTHIPCTSSRNTPPRSTTPRRRPSSPPPSTSTSRRTRRCFPRTMRRASWRSFRARCSAWTTRRAGSAWWIGRTGMRLFS